MLKRNLVANYLGQAWVALMGLIFVPLYIQYLGIESYGLIGLFAILSAWMSLFDMGMTPALGREMARFSADNKSNASIRDILRTVESIAFFIALLVAMGIWLASDWLANDWLRAEELPSDVVSKAFIVMGMVTSLRFIEGVYRSAIVGLQRQVLFNIVSAIMATFRGLGAVAILAWVSPTIEAFFLWQGVISILTVVLLALATYHEMPKNKRGRFSLRALHHIRRFAGGMMGIVFLSLLLTQVDKILLSKLLTLSEYGYYTLAAVVAGVLAQFISPITQAFYPKLCELHAIEDEEQFSKEFHKAAQLLSVVVGSVAVVIMFFSETLLNLWTQDTDLTQRTYKILAVLILGNLLNGLMWMPYQAQLAYGWTSLMVRINTVAVLIIIPAILWVTPIYGALGAAWIWASLNAGYVLIGVHFMFRRIITKEKWEWYIHDVIFPLLGAVVAALVVRSLAPTEDTPYHQLGILVVAGILTLIVSAISAPIVRQYMVNKYISISMRG